MSELEERRKNTPDAIARWGIFFGALALNVAIGIYYLFPGP